jgi:hypothetical protein
MTTVKQLTSADFHFDGIVGQTYTYSIGLGALALWIDPYYYKVPSIRIHDDGLVESPPGNTSGLDIDYIRTFEQGVFPVFNGYSHYPVSFQPYSRYGDIVQSSAFLDQGFAGASLVGTSGPNTLDPATATLNARDASAQTDSGFISIGDGGSLTWSANASWVGDVMLLYGVSPPSLSLQIGILGPASFTVESFDTVSPPHQTSLNLTGTDADDTIRLGTGANAAIGSGDDVIDGKGGSDDIAGSAGNDTLIGGLGDDRLEGGAGDDAIDGGPGADTAVFAAARSDYLVSLLSNGDLEITDQRPGSPDGTDTVHGVERFLFSDAIYTADALFNRAPAITSDGGDDAATVSVAENTVSVTVIKAVDPDAGTTITYSISGGADASLFQIDPAAGALSFISAPNFEAPADANHDNSYVVQVRALDGSLSDAQTITVSVTDVVETVHWTESVDAGGHPGAIPRGGVATVDWVPQGIGDFDGNGTSDLAWYNSVTGKTELWKLQDGQWAGSSDIGAHPAGYWPAGYGDFNHDGMTDKLWFNPSTRDVDLWKMADGHWAGSVGIGTHPAGYQPALTGDFNGDGTADIAWFNGATGDVDLWKISDGHWAGSIDVGTHPAGHQPVLSGDFNGDGTSDIAWYNPTSGDVDIWKMADGHWAGSVDVGSHPAGWQPLGAADFNKDGTSDIAWYNPTTNNIDVWLIHDGHWAGSVDLGSHPAGWTPAGLGDFDHNGVSDVMWFNATTGHIDNWMLAYS